MTKKHKIPAAGTAGGIVTAYQMYQNYEMGKKDTSFPNAAAAWTYYTFGVKYGNKWDMARPIATFGPLALGAGISMLAAKTKINKYVRIPFFGI